MMSTTAIFIVTMTKKINIGYAIPMMNGYISPKISNEEIILPPHLMEMNYLQIELEAGIFHVVTD